MLDCLEKPSKELKEVLDKFEGWYSDRYKDRYPQNSIECDYIHAQVEDKEKFETCIKEAIEKIEEASRYTKSHGYPHYTPFKKLNWVDKEVFEEWKGKKLETVNASHGLFVERYEYGEHYLYQDSSKYGLYVT